MAAFTQWAEAQLKAAQAHPSPDTRGMRLESLDSDRPEMQTALARAKKFLNLVALLAALLSAVAPTARAGGCVCGGISAGRAGGLYLESGFINSKPSQAAR